jgi:segregation and condensation protein B
MEVLAIVAYRQPLTMSEIDVIRGVQSDYSVKALLERRLIQEVGRKHTPGRPVLYGTSSQFLHQFKLNDLGQLPALETVNLEVLQLNLPVVAGSN